MATQKDNTESYEDDDEITEQEAEAYQQQRRNHPVQLVSGWAVNIVVSLVIMAIVMVVLTFILPDFDFSLYQGKTPAGSEATGTVIQSTKNYNILTYIVVSLAGLVFGAALWVMNDMNTKSSFKIMLSMVSLCAVVLFIVLYVFKQDKILYAIPAGVLLSVCIIAFVNRDQYKDQTL